MLLQTAGGQKIQLKEIDYILNEQITGLEATAVRLKDGRLHLVLHSEEELVREMMKDRPLQR